MKKLILWYGGGVMKKWILLMGLALSVLVMAGCGKDNIPLNALLYFKGSEIGITNNGNFDWENTVIEINPHIKGGCYLLEAGRLVARKDYAVGAGQFTRKDGTRFNPLQIKLLRVFIYCDTPEGQGMASFSDKNGFLAPDRL